jgi:hypothetical protein
VTQQLQKSIDFRQNDLYDFHLWLAVENEENDPAG